MFPVFLTRLPKPYWASLWSCTARFFWSMSFFSCHSDLSQDYQWDELCLNWTNSHMMAYWSKITVSFAGPQKHQCSFFMVINICCFSFSNLLFLNVDNSQLSKLGNCIFCFGEFLQVHLKFNFFIDFFRSGVTKFPKNCFWIFEFEIKK